MRRVWVRMDRLHSEEQKRGKAPRTMKDRQTDRTTEKCGETERQYSKLRNSFQL
jgi:hypothetical protein